MKRNAETADRVDFAFRLDGRSGVPVYRQLIDQVQGAIAAGVLSPGDQLPTVRWKLPKKNGSGSWPNW